MIIYVVCEFDWGVLGVFNSIEAAHNFVLKHIRKTEIDTFEPEGTYPRGYYDYKTKNGRKIREYQQGYYITQFKLNEQEI
jgi:hypothetical protein